MIEGVNMTSPPKKTKVKTNRGSLTRKTIGEVLVDQVVSINPWPNGLHKVVSTLTGRLQGRRSRVKSLSGSDPFSSPAKVNILISKGQQSLFFPTQTVIEIIDDGLSTVVFRELCDFLGLSDKALAEIIRIPISTLANRKKKGYFSPTESERIYRILNLYKQALDTFDGNEEYARKWLKEDAQALGGVPPLEFAKTELGAKEVEQLLIRIDEGIFA